MTVVDAGIYGGGPLYAGGDAVIEELRASGMTTVVAWSVHVNPNGDLVFNDPTIVSGGRYVGDPGWPARLAGLKAPSSSVTRLLFSVGSGGASDFHNIQALIRAGEAKPGGILFRNFAALRSAIPTIDGIDFDDEDLLDADTTVAFAQMLHGLGFEVTFCPYEEPDYWTGCLRRLNGPTPGLVTGFNLQCYSGGGDNQPSDWVKAVQAAMGPGFDAAGFVRPGLWCIHTPDGGPTCSDGQCPDSIEATFQGWRELGLTGGWIWLLDDVLKCEGSGTCSVEPMGVEAYAQAIVAGLGG